MSAAEETKTETHPFQAEVSQLLKLVINSLYSHKEIFLRELISNASDALDRLKFRSITEPALVAPDSALEIRIVPDKDAGTLTIEDTGVGMNHDELVKNLGTIAHSGSRAFIEQLAQRGQKDVNLIGQFGVGFYSAYLVADRVEVVSRAAGASEAFRWASDAKDAFTVSPAERASQGTSVILHLKDDQKSFLDDWELRQVITKYSDYVNHAIKVQITRPEAEGKPAETAFETVNRASALWQRTRTEITDEQYEEFYKHLTHDNEPALARTHFKVEGQQEFAGLLFIPKHKPFDFNVTQTRRGIRLFVKRVFIMDNCEELLPSWLRFVRGVVDSDDLPLNVSREVLQDSAVVRSIRKQVVKKTLELLEETAKDKPEDYKTFWQAFGSALKEGLPMEFEYRERLGGLLRYESTRDQGLTSLADYIARMPEGQDAIYYIFGESQKALANSPHLEALRKKNYEVLLMTDPIDEWAADGLREFKGKKLVSAMRADLKLDESDDAKRDRAEKSGALKNLIERAQAVLGDKVSDVRISDRLTDSPCCLVVPEGASHAYLERLLKEHGRDPQTAKRILEINPGHPLVDALRALNEKDANAESVTEWIELLYDQALLTEGSRIEDPNRFAQRLTSLMQTAAIAAMKA